MFLAVAIGSLAVGRTDQKWFLVPGTKIDTTDTRLDRPSVLDWHWSDVSWVSITLEPLDDVTAVTGINAHLASDGHGEGETALNATEDFALFLADLKFRSKPECRPDIMRG